MRTRKSAPPERGAFFGIFNEVDAASGARGDWRRDADGNDSAAGAVRPEAQDMAMPATEIANRWKSST